MKKRILIILTLFTLSSFNLAFSSQPSVNCAGLPGCKTESALSTDGGSSGNIGLKFFTNSVSEFIQFIAVIAVLALIFSGVLYLISMGDEEKTKKAKKWIIYSLVAVFVSISSWGIINILNNIRIQ